MEYITAREAAEKWNVSQRLVQKYCAQGRIDNCKVRHSIYKKRG